MTEEETCLSPEIVIRNWRVMRAEPTGALIWFDPEREVPSLRALSRKELSRGERLELEMGLDRIDVSDYLDRSISVSASEPSRAPADRYEQVDIEEVIEDELPF